MFKKLTAICLAFILVISMALVPVFASDNQSTTTTDAQANMVSNDKKVKDDKNGKDHDDDYEDLIENVIKKFLDSNEFSWAEKSIEKMGLMGILNGTGNGYFKPKSNVTHVEAIAMVLKLTGYQKEAEAIRVEPKYFKGKSDPWSYGYLQLALDKGIIIPSEDGSFNPKTPAKRHEVAKYVVRALGERKEALDNMKAKLDYEDAASIPAGSRGYVHVITEMKIMQGSNNLFQPNKPITRAELAVILDKAEGKTDEPSSSTNKYQGAFVAFDEEDLEITIKADGKSYTYDVNKNAPVYKNSKYYKISSLDAGDVIKLVLDNDKKVIFIEFIEEGTADTDEDELTIAKMSYSNLPNELQDKVDEMKEKENYAAFEYDEDLYLIATRGEVPTGGYTIKINHVYMQKIDTNEYNLKVVVEKTNPGSSIVTQATEEPFTVVKLENIDDMDDIENVKFVNTSGSTLKTTTIKAIDDEEIINGTIKSIDVDDDEVTLALSTTVSKTYEIPAAADITLDGDDADLSELKVGMKAKITKTNDVITDLDVTSLEEVINGTIYSIDVNDDEVTLTQSTTVRKTYEIPDTADITLDGDDADLSELERGMKVKMTKTNGVITELEVTTVKETINGTIYSIDVNDDEIRLTESTTVRKTYEIPDTADITLDGDDADLSELKVGMKVKMTKTNGVITELEVTTLIETITGTIYSVDLSDDEVRLTEKDNVRRTYVIPDDAEITLEGDDANLSELERGMTAEITKTNGVITNLDVED
jgi:protein involved in ribonucleotide reduction